LGGVLGLLDRDAEAFLKSAPGERLGEADIQRLIAERKAARSARNFARADDIRKELLEKGVVLEDGAQGTTWRRA
jgi:cysteinyl-tRNA synthetase